MKTLQPRKKVMVREDVCIGCRLCEFHCAAEHHPSKNLIKAFKGGEEKPRGRVRVVEDGPLSFALVCRHCDEPLCAYACVSGAMAVNPATGRVVHDPERCISCMSCVMACANGSIIWDEDGGIVTKCDLCPGRDIPACVEHCPNEALFLTEGA